MFLLRISTKWLQHLEVNFFSIYSNPKLPSFACVKGYT
jgi:hypothetical protein